MKCILFRDYSKNIENMRRIKDGRNIFVIIVTFNGKKYFERCISSVLSANEGINIIVVDNASNDGTPDMIAEKFPDIVLFKNDKNIGFGQANNMGIKYAIENDCDYVFLLNQDAYIQPTTITHLVSVSEMHPEYGILSPMHFANDNSRIDPAFLQYIADWRNTDDHLIEDMYFNRLKEDYCTNYVNAAAWLIPRNTLNIIGGFDPFFFHYGEDNNYLQRVRFHGLKIAICPNSAIIHDRLERMSYNKRDSEFHEFLCDITDITHHIRICEYQASCFRKMVSMCLKGDKCRSSRYSRQWQYILKNHSQIRKSRKMNETKGLTWLDKM